MEKTQLALEHNFDDENSSWLNKEKKYPIYNEMLAWFDEVNSYEIFVRPNQDLSNLVFFLLFVRGKCKK